MWKELSCVTGLLGDCEEPRAAMGLGDYFEHHDGMHYHAQHDNRDERGLRLEVFQDLDVGEGFSRPHLSFLEMQIRNRELESLDHHYALRNDLIDHL